MSNSIAISIIVFIIFGSIVIIFVAQAREKAQLAAARRANVLADRYRRLQRILDDIPNQYLAKEIRLLLLERSVETLEQIKKLKGDAFRFQRQLDADQQSIENLKNGDVKETAEPIADEEKVNEVRTLLQTVISFLESQRQKGNISSQLASAQSDKLRYYIVKSKADLYENRANAAIKLGRLRVAIHNFQSAITELEAIASIATAQDAIAAFRIKINEIEKRIAEEEDTAKVKSETEKRAADKEWDNYIGGEEEWKKKNTYDD
ncbi:MAG: hypothetical protein CSA50_03835 [Gammaproteobacteria bacterium]|nr:MAG: hypothetical protein CSA50_03835 [Gammaproteobacteria bacterium]